nr:MAG TPA: hypothetical protein [Caudoviricetes sp.]
MNHSPGGVTLWGAVMQPGTVTSPYKCRVQHIL